MKNSGASLEQGEEINAKMRTAARRHIEPSVTNARMELFFVVEGANVNIKDRNNYTPPDSATWNYDTNIAERLSTSTV